MKFWVFETGWVAIPGSVGIISDIGGLTSSLLLSVDDKPLILKLPGLLIKTGLLDLIRLVLDRILFKFLPREIKATEMSSNEVSKRTITPIETPAK